MVAKLKALGKGKGSWKTTAAGVFCFLGVLSTALQAALDSDPTTVAEWDKVLAGAVVALGLIMARDNDVTSEEAKAK